MTGDIVFLLVLLPVLIYSAWTDLRYMRLFNATNLICAALFVVVAPVFLPIADIAFRLGMGLGVGFLLILASVAGAFGAGDAKYIAALLPWVDPADYAEFCVILSGALLIGLAVLRLGRASAALRAATPTWRAWRKAKIPMGVPISAAMLLYLTGRLLPLDVVPG